MVILDVFAPVMAKSYGREAFAFRRGVDLARQAGVVKIADEPPRLDNVARCFFKFADTLPRIEQTTNA